MSSHLITARIYVSRAVFPLLMVYHFLHTSPHKMSIFLKIGNMQFFFQELYSHIDKNSGGKV